MTQFSKLSVGSVLSEAQYYIVAQIKGDKVQLKNHNGELIVLDKNYVEKLLASAEQFSSTEKITRTALAEKFISSARVAMTVCFYKADKVKTKKAFTAEKEEMIEKIKNARVGEIEGLLSDLIENPITMVIPGELRVMKGYHTGLVNELGRVDFIDMEKVGEHNLRQVDPRTIQYIIINNVKYEVK